MEYDYTIVESLDGIIEYLKAAEIDLDDDKFDNTDDAQKPKIIITGVPMTRKQFSEWFKVHVYQQ
jgi:molecular chaperone GrpE (heat shock protein)